MSISLDANAECPFFLSQDDRNITCESYIEGNNVKNKVAFRRTGDKQKHFDEVCCCNGGKSCRHYQIMSYLYESGVLK
ncbi:MAG: hypothetical protein J6P97_00955 [Bacteroidales bacterium]|nr:hypothetical protein [Bacteroidales bacterium]